MFLDDVAQLLEDAGVGIYTSDTNRDIYASSMPDMPNDAISVIEYVGAPPTFVHNKTTPRFEYPNAQIAVRSMDYELARTRAQRAFQAVSVQNRSINGSWYLSVTPSQAPFSIGVDDRGRERVGFNLQAMKESVEL